MRTILLALLLCVLLAAPSSAYIDPGAGSIMLQVVIGVLIGLFLRFRAAVGRAVSALASLFGRKG